MFSLGITDHLEGPADRPSVEIYREVEELVLLADSLGVEYFWFAEHHAHAHEGHLPTPLLFALHLAGKTRQIRLGSAIVCLNLHHPLAVAEQAAVADWLTGGRLAPGFGSGSTPEEFELFGLKETQETERHVRFAESLRIIREAWKGEVRPQSLEYFNVPAHVPLPVARTDLAARSWLAVNSAGSARIAGEMGLGMLFSHLRTVQQYREYVEAYRAAGGQNQIAVNRPVYVGEDDDSAWAEAAGAVRTLWRRFREEGKIPSQTPEPSSISELCGHPLNFIVGGPESVARQLIELHAQVPFDVANLEVRWEGLSHRIVLESLRRLTTVRALREQVVKLDEHGQRHEPDDQQEHHELRRSDGR
jgi:alkanesulfonate monooxygenase SsuD/methylene tetrahydromethanopterin reductase-like flavin-dependent oxidoreductase (luciferase family)